MVTCFNLNICNVFEKWENKGRITSNDKIYVVDIVTFIEDILVITKIPWLKKWTHPGNEGCLVFRLEEFNILVSLFVNVNGDFNLKLVW